jgi:tRNA threonylcarbamoyladenosine biosynthesis protein TsaB
VNRAGQANRSRAWLLAIDTATSVVVVAAGARDGTVLATRTFAAGHRHGSHLLPSIQALMADERLELRDLAGVVVGLGPGAFTGLRVGLATAKTVAHETDAPIVGVSTGEALLHAAGPGGDRSKPRVFLPAGPRDRVVIQAGQTPLLETGAPAPEPPLAIAVDLDGRASDAALERGRQAVERLPAALLELGAARLRAGATDDVERLVPAYVSLARGVAVEVGDGGVAWSRDPR